MDDEHISKTEAAYRTLRRDILSARLAPGSALKLGALRNTYGIGWTPLREALSRLEAEHLVTAISNRGFAVAPVSRSELEDLTRSRLLIEMPLFAESIGNGGCDWEAAIITAHYRLSRCTLTIEHPSEAALDEWDEKHQAFHDALLSAATSPWLLRFQQTIAGQLRRHHRFLSLAPMLRSATGSSGENEEALAALRDATAIEHHTHLMEAALDRDIERATALMAEHIGYTIKVYDRSEDAPSGKSKRRSSRNA
jgi:GntR family carbon starvation induced transcriptional regulator